MVGLDSGPLHLAAALGKPGVGIYGPSDPARTGPYGGTITVLRTAGAFTTYRREQEIIESFLESFAVVPGTESDALAALDLYKRFHLSHGVDWPDCQIAATALRLDAIVHTLNIKHFAALPGLRAARAY